MYPMSVCRGQHLSAMAAPPPNGFIVYPTSPTSDKDVVAKAIKPASVVYIIQRRKKNQSHLSVLRLHLSVYTQDYKFLCAAVTICSTLVYNI